MQIIIEPDAENRIWEFYYNCIIARPNIYTQDNAHRDIDKVYDEAYKVGGTELIKVNPSTSYVISKWKSYNVDRSETGWYFAYKIEGNVIRIYDAEHHSCMSDNAHTSKNRVQQSNENYQENSKSLLVEQQVKTSLDFMWRLLEVKI